MSSKSIRFLFNGDRICDFNTAQQIGIDDGDILDAMYEVCCIIKL